MAKELYLYSNIYNFVAEDLMQRMEDAGDNIDITLRINSGGGDVMAGYGIMAKIQERTGKTNMKVDGVAASFAAQLLLFGDDVECLNTSTFMLHRAAGDTSTAEGKALVDKVNADLRKQLTARINDAKLQELKGVSIKNLFEDEKRIDLFLTAAEAKKIGLVNKVNTLSPVEAKAVSERMFAIAAMFTIPAQVQEPNTPIKMTIEKIKAEHPDVFAQIVAIGVSKEKERVEACLVFNHLDAAGVTAAIKSGNPLSQVQMAEFALKAMSPAKVAAVAAGATGTVVTDEVTPEATAKEKEISEFAKATYNSFGLK